MSEWNDGVKETLPESPRLPLVGPLLSSLEQNDADYLAEKITREEWTARATELDNKLSVIGLRLAVKPGSR